jgi:hypothetical protein
MRSAKHGTQPPEGLPRKGRLAQDNIPEITGEASASRLVQKGESRDFISHHSTNTA